jgi:hypothetical protein
VNALDNHFSAVFLQWMEQRKRVGLSLDHSTESIVSYLMHNCTEQKKDALDLLYPEFVFN